MILDGGSVDNIGIYAMKMIISQDLFDQAHGYSQPYRGTMDTIEYAFTVEILPCVISSFSSNTIPDVELATNDPSFTTNKMLFTQSPICNYAETLSMTTLPAFITYNEATKDFTIEGLDTNAVGIYTIEVQSEIRVPDNSEKSSYTTEKATSSFKITIKPCTFNSNNQVEFVGDMRYAIGGPTLISTAYLFE